MSLSILRRQIFKLYFKYVHEIIFAQQTRTNPMVSDVAGHICNNGNSNPAGPVLVGPPARRLVSST